MKNQRMRYIATGVLAVGLVIGQSAVHAQTVESVLDQSKTQTAELKQTQKRIDGISEQTDKIVQDYKTVVKQVEGLKIYNAQQELQIADQKAQLATLEESIANAATLERDIAPLMERMITALQDFVALDLPFNVEERTERVAKLQNNLGRADLTTAEKFRQVLEAYKIEIDYGNNIDFYDQTVVVDGAEQDVNILRIGRISLMYQTKDQSRTAVWSKEANDWEVLNQGEWGREVAEGLKIARKQSPINIMTIPVSAPVEASR